MPLSQSSDLPTLSATATVGRVLTLHYRVQNGASRAFYLADVALAVGPGGTPALTSLVPDARWIPPGLVALTVSLPRALPGVSYAAPPQGYARKLEKGARAEGTIVVPLPLALAGATGPCRSAKLILNAVPVDPAKAAKPFFVEGAEVVRLDPFASREAVPLSCDIDLSPPAATRSP